MQDGTSWQSATLDSPSGAALQLYELIPAKPKAILHINHGMAEHAGRYHRFARALHGAGYGAVAHDHRGHGRTTAPDAAQGHYANSGGWEKVMADVAAVNSHIDAEHPGVPVIVFGHSMGAIIAFNHLLRKPDTVSGAALWNSGVETGLLGLVFSGILRIQRMLRGADVPSPLAKKATFEAWNRKFAPNRTEFDWLSRDEAEVDKYVSDPLCGFDVSIGLWLDLLEGIRHAADDANLAHLPAAMPVHLQAGSADPCSQYGKAVENIAARMRKAGMSDVTFELLPETRHESLNEINSDAVTEQFVQWLDARFGASG